MMSKIKGFFLWSSDYVEDCHFTACEKPTFSFFYATETWSELEPTSNQFKRAVLQPTGIQPGCLSTWLFDGYRTLMAAWSQYSSYKNIFY